MGTTAQFPQAQTRAGMYESFYLRAVSPHDPVGIWIRHTVHKPPGQRARGSVWCTVFDARRGRPFMHKLTTDELSVPADGWIAIGQSTMDAARAEGACGAASWTLRYACEQDELRHLSPPWLYRTPLPRTKLTTPLPLASFHGVLEVGGRDRIELDGWPGMVGHNWGSEHAERWIWLHGVAFEDAPSAWLDVALARLKLAGRLTPWVATGALSLDGRRHRIGGLGARGTCVREDPDGCTIELSGPRGLTLHARAEVPEQSAAGWRYSDPGGQPPSNEHDVMNCSVAAIQLSLSLAAGEPRSTLRSDHGGAYELGMRERDHGVPIAPFGDG